MQGSVLNVYGCIFLTTVFINSLGAQSERHSVDCGVQMYDSVLFPFPLLPVCNTFKSSLNF